MQAGAAWTGGETELRRHVQAMLPTLLASEPPEPVSLFLVLMPFARLHAAPDRDGDCWRLIARVFPHVVPAVRLGVPRPGRVAHNPRYCGYNPRHFGYNVDPPLALQCLGMPLPCGDLELLFRHRHVDPNARYGPRRETALHLCARHDAPALVPVLLRYGADPAVRSALDEDAEGLAIRAAAWAVLAIFSSRRQIRWTLNRTFGAQAKARAADVPVFSPKCKLATPMVALVAAFAGV